VADAPTPSTASPRPPGRGRRTLARALVVVGVLLAVVSGLANFVRYEALDNDQFRETSRLLISNEEIQGQVAATLVDALYTNIDVAAELGVSESRISQMRAEALDRLRGALEHVLDGTPADTRVPGSRRSSRSGVAARRKQDYYDAVATRRTTAARLTTVS